MAEELQDIEPLRPLLSHKPFAILSDIDGTLAPIVPNPEDARISSRARDALLQLTGQGVLVAFVTGRAPEKARELVAIPGAFIASNHGLNVEADGKTQTPDEVQQYAGWARQVIRDASALRVRGVIVEDKGPVVAFHYRTAESESEARAAIADFVSGSAAAAHFQVHEGRKVIELRPPLDVHKGTAAELLIGRMGAKSVLAIGDDVTDLDMFRAVHSSGGFGGQRCGLERGGAAGGAG